MGTEDNLRELVFSFHHVSWGWNSGCLSSKHPHSLSHLIVLMGILNSSYNVAVIFAKT